MVLGDMIFVIASAAKQFPFNAGDCFVMLITFARLAMTDLIEGSIAGG